MTWVASFPKSGNTWVRHICFYLVHEREPVSSKEMDGFINSRFVADNSGRFIKTHAETPRLTEWFDSTARAIYVHRHPLDVLCSAADYAVLIGDAKDEADAGDAAAIAAWRRGWIADVLDHGAPPGWMEAYRTGSWSDNITSWLFTPLPFPVLRLSYEDMIASPHEAVARIAGFIGTRSDPAFVTRCVDASSFGQMQAMENAEFDAMTTTGTGGGRFTTGSRLDAMRHGYRFFRSGRIGSYMGDLEPAEIARARRVFGDVADRLGYQL